MPAPTRKAVRKSSVSKPVSKSKPKLTRKKRQSGG